jgi:hypothetical protein
MSVYTDAENSSNRHPPMAAEICQNRTKCGNSTEPQVVTYAWLIRTRHQLPIFWVGQSVCKSGLIAFGSLRRESEALDGATSAEQTRSTWNTCLLVVRSIQLVHSLQPRLQIQAQQKQLPKDHKQRKPSSQVRTPLQEEMRSDLLRLFMCQIFRDLHHFQIQVTDAESCQGSGFERKRTSVSTFLLEARSALLPANAITKLGFPGKGHNGCMSGRLAQE